MYKPMKLAVFTKTPYKNRSALAENEVNRKCAVNHSSLSMRIKSSLINVTI